MIRTYILLQYVARGDSTIQVNRAKNVINPRNIIGCITTECEYIIQSIYISCALSTFQNRITLPTAQERCIF